VVDSGAEIPSPANQDNAKQSTNPAGHDMDAASLAGEFESLPVDYQNVIRLRSTPTRYKGSSAPGAQRRPYRSSPLPSQRIGA
jgi:hypothetical protein